MRKRQSAIIYVDRFSKNVDFNTLKSNDDLRKAVEEWQKKPLSINQKSIIDDVWIKRKPKVVVVEKPEERVSILEEYISIQKKDKSGYYYGEVTKRKNKEVVIISPRKFKKRQIRDKKTGRIIGWE